MYLKGLFLLFSEWGPTLIMIGVGSLALVGLFLVGVLLYFGSKSTLGCCRVFWACLKKFEVEFTEPQCACINVRKKQYCPTREAETAGEYCRSRKDGENVDIGGLASDSDEELKHPPSVPTYRAVVKRNQGPPSSRRRLFKLKNKVSL